MGRITLITGGGRSGKSRHAMELAMARPAPRAFIATAEPFDDEMRERIARHRRERAGAFATIEEPVDLAGALGRVPPGTTVALVDCLTIWLANVMHRRGEGAREYPEIAAFVAALKAAPCDVIAVTNEVGMGIIPTDSELSRRFRDQAGWLNQAVAQVADEVVLVVSGIPLVLKRNVE
ncbi:MAG TPA: bifunctional adenosylcobinamide kinase/adenosylcobinamide-phosphate guanylyltransferase [Planctomycetota bacterium]|nr:bifunctional adenosylcobinamide kinase/adenosylcobinamide-phosphate guanylyltransferase [Planctomycetota bacterium]